jgi:cytochrome c-type biogenesis protein CcsB
VAGIAGSMAHLSDTLYTTANSVYALAMVSYTAEYAFGRKGRIAATAPVQERARELVGANGGPGASWDVTGGAGSATLEPDTPVDAGGPTSGGRTFADRAGRFAVLLSVIGALIHLSSIGVRAIAVDAVPWSNMYEFASVAGLVGIVAFLGGLWRAPQIRHLGGFILLPVILMMFLAGTVLYSKAQPLVPALQSYWLAIHVSLAAVSEGALMTSAVLTILFLLKSHYDRVAAGSRGSAGGRPGAVATARGRQGGSGGLAGLAAKLPPSDTLDKVAYRIVAFAFPLYTVAIICGAIWAEAAWGRYWGWDPKETWAFIVWIAYACYLHARATAGWKGRAAAWINLTGFAAITFNFFVVNIVVSGLHSYAGLS